jgi:uncharacterized protein (DUF2126 family)/transglutaminase-like putative cysteine protease
MSIRVAIEHRTVYRYDGAVELGPHEVRLRPAPHCRTPILAYSLTVEPAEHFINWQQDPFGNHIARLNFRQPVRELVLSVDLIAELAVINPFDFFVQETAASWPFAYEPALAGDLQPFLAVTESGPRLTQWLAEIPRQPVGVIDFLVDLNHRVLGAVEYSVRMEEGVLSAEETLTRGIGSCRDSAWLLVQALRSLGLAARFVSGYLVQVVEDGDEDGAELAGDSGEPGTSGSGTGQVRSDFTDLHAWAEVYIPGAGWIGLDATSGLLAGEGHIPLACTTHPAAAAPVTGSVSAATAELTYSGAVTRIHEPPRVTRPYTETQWRQIDGLGHAVDALLEARDVRLTMGGEPTFVSSAQVDEPEWGTAALGGDKEELAGELAGRLAAHFAPDALIMHTQGKWYPGEPLPRWQIGIYWRTDGRPLWREPGLLADPAVPASFTDEDAAELMRSLTVALGLAPDAGHAAHEDPISEYWAAVRKPGADPKQAKPAKGPPRRGDPVGWVLPLHRESGERRWSSDAWRLARGALYLTPGDSPIGMRLPLEELTWVPQDEEPPHLSALCVQQRDGHIHVFMPPTEEFAYATELVETLEDVTAALALAIVVEGYAPASDPRRGSFVVAPDPGVIEINIHPSGSWPELAARTLTIADEAADLGLACEKFALDGKHTGTGGGSHITLGGTTPADSPLLRRPALLRSMLTYWQHHPALSYAFSGQFIGPTSQSPRVDEARHDSLYELEIAFAELERLSERGTPPLWQVDRLLRHLLVDLTGNTHRAEFCIDKLYSPDSASGRLGVLELRGFEMAPHPRMQLVQALLVRALVARLWADPYTGDLVRWGADLHDRFMLPWWVQRDLETIVADLRAHGIAFELEWFNPFLEFRFPLLGEIAVDSVTLELRDALEPWHVLGEEASGSGTARYVDSSVQRLQVRVDGMIGDRYAVVCNGYTVPLQSTEIDGTAVAGVRYRAWSPYSALHPTIGIQAPLSFDLVDRWSGRSLGGCRYHVIHPGGLAYETRPVNGAAAEARRRSRFETLAHSDGTIVAPVLRRSAEYPRTLDLRRAGFRR